MMRFSQVLPRLCLLPLLVACTPFPDVGPPPPPAEIKAVILPLDQVLAQEPKARITPQSGEALAARGEALKARARAMQGDLQDPATRERLRRAAEAAAAGAAETDALGSTDAGSVSGAADSDL